MPRGFQATGQMGIKVPAGLLVLQLGLCLKPILPSEGESLHCFQHHTPGLAHTRSSRNTCMKPGPAELQANMPSGAVDSLPLNGSQCCTPGLTVG